MGISGKEGIFIYIFFPNENMTQMQIIEGDSYVHTFSKDSRMLIAQCNEKI